MRSRRAIASFLTATACSSTACLWTDARSATGFASRQRCGPACDRRVGGLALWTPVGRSCAEALSAHEDCCSAAAAGVSLTAIDPKARSLIGGAGGAARAGVRDDAIAGGILHIGGEHALRGGHERVDLRIAE